MKFRYIVGFGASVLFGTFMGPLADRFGRKRLCLVFCGVYSLCCLTKISPNFWWLFVGRFFGNLSNSTFYRSSKKFDSIPFFQVVLVLRSCFLRSRLGTFASTRFRISLPIGFLPHFLFQLFGMEYWLSFRVLLRTWALTGLTLAQ